jgi:hypothetical protein
MKRFPTPGPHSMFCSARTSVFVASKAFRWEARGMSDNSAHDFLPFLLNDKETLRSLFNVFQSFRWLSYLCLFLANLLPNTIRVTLNIDMVGMCVDQCK